MPINGLGVLGAIICLLLFAGPAWSADHRNLEEGIPTTLEDAFPIAYRSIEPQVSFNFDNDGKQGDEFHLEPELKWGVIKNGHLALSVPLLFGDGDREGSGDITLEGLYNLNGETHIFPATAFAVEAEFPTGEERKGVDTTVKGILTKGVHRTRIHANAGFTNRGAARSTERDNRYTMTLGADHPMDFGLFPRALGLNNLVIANVVAEQSEQRGEKLQWIAELGVRHQFNPWTVLAFGAGAGLSHGAPDVRFIIGYQTTFAAF